MDLRHLGSAAWASAVLLAVALVACNNGSPPVNPYPGGGAGGGNGNYGGGVGASGSGSTGGYGTGGSTGGSGTTTGSATTSSGGTSGGTSTGTSGGTSGGSTTGGGGPNQLFGALAFTVASAGQFLPLGSLDGGPTQMEFDLASFVLGCPGGNNTQAGSVLIMTLYSGALDTPISSGTYQVRPAGGGLPYATATINLNDGVGNTAPIATGQSGQITWSPSFSGVASGTLSINMISSGGPSFLTGTFVAPYCGIF